LSSTALFRAIPFLDVECDGGAVGHENHTNWFLGSISLLLIKVFLLRHSIQCCLMIDATDRGCLREKDGKRGDVEGK
jgi:hypothetical protein